VSGYLTVAPIILDLLGPVWIVKNVPAEADGLVLAGLELFGGRDFTLRRVPEMGKDSEPENSSGSFPGLCNEAGGSGVRKAFSEEVGELFYDVAENFEIIRLRWRRLSRNESLLGVLRSHAEGVHRRQWEWG